MDFLIVWTAPAMEDLEELVRYIAQDDATAAVRVGNKIVDGNASPRRMKAPIKLETTQLILRQPLMSDAAKVFECYASNAEVTKFLG